MVGWRREKQICQSQSKRCQGRRFRTQTLRAQAKSALGNGWPPFGKAFAVKFHCPFRQFLRALESSVERQRKSPVRWGALEAGPREDCCWELWKEELREFDMASGWEGGFWKTSGDLLKIRQAGRGKQNGIFGFLPTTHTMCSYSLACVRVCTGEHTPVRVCVRHRERDGDPERNNKGLSQKINPKS